MDTIRAIVSIFNVCSIRTPAPWNVLACEPTTVVSEIENFVLRAELFPLADIVCPFIIVDFHRLPLAVQMRAHSFIEQRKLSPEKTLLVILFKQDGRVIE